MPEMCVRLLEAYYSSTPASVSSVGAEYPEFTRFCFSSELLPVTDSVQLRYGLDNASWLESISRGHFSRDHWAAELLWDLQLYIRL